MGLMLKYLIDENLRGRLWQFIQLHNARGIDPIDALRVGDPVDLPLGSDDPTILGWCESNQRILISADRKTMPAHIYEHLNQGKFLPGVFIVRRAKRLDEVLQFAVVAAYESDSNDCAGGITYVP